MSRLVDGSQINLLPEVFHSICTRAFTVEQRLCNPHLDFTWGFPTCDLFAGPNPEEHVASLYYTKNTCPGALGTDALCHDWNRGIVDKGRQLLWAFPPFYLIADCLNKIGQHKIDTILIVPKGVKSWTPLLRQLPVIAEISLSKQHAICSIGSQAPAYMKLPGFKLHLKAVYIGFGSQL